MIQSSDVTLTFEEIVAASRCRRDWLLELIAEDIISIDGVPEKSTFSGFHLARIRRAQRLSRDFEAGIPALRADYAAVGRGGRTQKNTASAGPARRRVNIGKLFD